MTVTFQREDFDTWLADARFFLEDHLRESGENFGSALNINHDFFIDLELHNFLYILTGRRDKELICYWIGAITPNILYQHFKTVHAIGYWVKPEYRLFTTYKFMKFVDQYFKDFEIKSIIQNARTINKMSGILEKLGYKKVEEVFTKVY